MGQGSVWTGAGVSTRMHTCTHTHAHVHSVRHMCACTPCPPRGSPGLQGPQHPPHSLSLPGSLPDQGQAGRMRSHPLAGSPERARSPCAAGGGGQVPHVPQLQGAGGARQRHQRWGHAAGAPTDLALGPGAAVESRAVGSSLAWWRKSPSVRWGRRLTSADSLSVQEWARTAWTC